MNVVMKYSVIFPPNGLNISNFVIEMIIILIKARILILFVFAHLNLPVL